MDGGGAVGDGEGEEKVEEVSPLQSFTYFPKPKEGRNQVRSDKIKFILLAASIIYLLTIGIPYHHHPAAQCPSRMVGLCLCMTTYRLEYRDWEAPYIVKKPPELSLPGPYVLRFLLAIPLLA